MEKMREEFELWYMELKCAHGVSERDLACEIEFDEEIGEYEYANAEYAWMGWKASRAALCVELPDNLNGEYYADGWNACLECVEGKLEGVGVSYK